MPENPKLRVVDLGAPKGVTTLSIDGELPCVIVFSSEKHVKYIPPIVDFIRETLRKKGFKVKLLSDETRDISRYADEFVRIADECVFGVVLLDGFRPNVLFEFGILLGLRKPVSVLMSEDAYISVTTLYENCKDAGLSPAEFGKLKNPKIKLGSSNDFSDLLTHILRYNPNTYKEKDEHVSKKLEVSIDKKKSEIKEELKRQLQKPGRDQTKLFAEIAANYFQNNAINFSDKKIDWALCL